YFAANDIVHGRELWHLAESVQIDVLPGSSTNRINLMANGFLPVAFLSSADFDAADIDVSDLSLFEFGDSTRAARVAPVSAQFVDVNGDGRLDLVLQFSLRDLQSSGAVTDTTTTVQLFGKLLDGESIVGEDLVNL